MAVDVDKDRLIASGTHAGTAEPFRVSPPEAVVYLNPISARWPTDNLGRRDGTVVWMVAHFSPLMYRFDNSL